jgi:putative ABC transport system permease protein
MLAPTLPKFGWRYLLRHPWQSALMVLGIALGVAVVVAIDLANASAERGFDLSTQAVAGRATHQITGPPTGLDERLYAQLRESPQGTRRAAPVVVDYVSSPQLGDRPLQLLGVDPFAEAPFRDYLAAAGPAAASIPTDFFSQPGAILISADNAERYSLALGDALTLMVGGHAKQAFVAGVLSPTDDLQRRALDDLLLADISTAQELTGKIGKLDRIDLILPEDDAAAVAGIQSLLPPSAHLATVGARAGAVEQMTAAFRTNLTALSLLALLVGLFLIYNTMTFSVVQRRPLFGTLRCLGVTRREVFGLVVSEALLVGLVGSALGLLLGLALGQGAVRLVTQTINDLYFVLNVRGVEVSAASLIKGAVMGIAATVLSAAPPAWEAASVPPRAALSRSGLESKARRAVGWAAVGGLVLGGLGIGLLYLPGRSLVISFAGTFAVIVGFAMLAPLTTRLLVSGASRPAGGLWGVLGRMAPRDVVNSLSRTSVAVAALMIAVSVTIGVSVMVGSFRHTVVAWLAQTLQGDIYVSLPGPAPSESAETIEPGVVQQLKSWPGVARVDSLRSVTVDSPDGPIHVAAVDNPSTGEERIFLASDGPPESVWQGMQPEGGAVIVSEPLANRLGLPRHGGSITLFTDSGPRIFPIIGIYYDYTSSEGTVLMSLPLYRQLWNDTAVTAVAVRLASGADPEVAVRALQDGLSTDQRLSIRSNRTLRDEALAVFDRTFAITAAMQLLATGVAFIGVLSTLLSLQLEKQRELGILRAVGLTARELWGLVMLETGLMGASAGLLAMPAGFALALILIYIINRRSFGWTLQLQLQPAPFVQAVAVAVLAALLAGLYPARRMSRMAAAEALRYE